MDDDGPVHRPGAGVRARLFVKDADPTIVEDLRERGVLFREETYEHTYPFCWRCETPLLYYARSSWYVRTTAVKERLLEVNEHVNWFPDHIKHGRYGNWLENNVDWALSRERYWGTPLPIWRCANGHMTAIGSLAGARRARGPRRVATWTRTVPAIDEVTFPCPECGETATRVPEVIDTWYDSGAMPFAQWGYHPELGRGEAEFAAHFPADFISEAIDQTRGWFYTLMAEGVLHFDSIGVPQRRVPRPPDRRRTAGRCRSRSATCSTRGRRSTVRGPTPCGGSCSRTARRGNRVGSATRSSTRCSASSC